MTSSTTTPYDDGGSWWPGGHPNYAQALLADLSRSKVRLWRLRRNLGQSTDAVYRAAVARTLAAVEGRHLAHLDRAVRLFPSTREVITVEDALALDPTVALDIAMRRGELQRPPRPQSRDW